MNASDWINALCDWIEREINHVESGGKGRPQPYTREMVRLGRLAAAKEEQQRSPTWLGHCSGCTDSHSEGTHQLGTIEHPDIDKAKEEQAKVSGLTVDAIVQVVKEWHLDWCDSSPANATDFDVLAANIRNALEAHIAEKGGDNLRRDGV